MFQFNDFLNKLGYEPAMGKIRLLRHDQSAIVQWNRGGKTALGCYASFQKPGSELPYNNAEIACHLLPRGRVDGYLTALFVGITRINRRYCWNGKELPAIVDEHIVDDMLKKDSDELEAVDLEWLRDGQEYEERILIK